MSYSVILSLKQFADAQGSNVSKKWSDDLEKLGETKLQESSACINQTEWAAAFDWTGQVEDLALTPKIPSGFASKFLCNAFFSNFEYFTFRELKYMLPAIQILIFEILLHL